MELLPLGLVIVILAIGWKINRATGLIPDRLVFPSVLVAFLFSAVFPAGVGGRSSITGFALSLFGCAVGFGNALLAAYLAKCIWGRKCISFSPPADFSIRCREGENAEIRVGDRPVILADLFTTDSDVVRVEAEQVVVKAADTVHEARSRLFKIGFGWVALDAITFPMTPRLDLTGRITKLDYPRDIIGMGAIKAMMLPGAFLGWRAAVFTLWLAALLVGTHSLVKLCFRRPIARVFQLEPYVIAALLAWAWWSMRP